MVLWSHLLIFTSILDTLSNINGFLHFYSHEQLSRTTDYLDPSYTVLVQKNKQLNKFVFIF